MRTTAMETFPAFVGSPETQRVLREEHRERASTAPNIEELEERERERELALRAIDFIHTELDVFIPRDRRHTETDRLGHPRDSHPSLEALRKLNNTNGQFFPLEQTVEIKNNLSEISFLHATLHEEIHRRSFQSFHRSKSGSLRPRHIGFQCEDSEKRIHGTFLNEAVTEYLAKQLHQKLLETTNDPKLIAQRDKIEKLKSKYDERLTHTNDTYDAITETRYVGGAKKQGLAFKRYAYPQERKYFSSLVDGLARLENIEWRDMQRQFLEAYFSGKLLTIARLCRKHFPKHSFEDIINGKVHLAAE